MTEPRTNLQKVRIKKGLSQKELSTLSGVPFKSIQNYEQRHRDIDGAKLETLCDIAAALDCGIENITESETLKKKYIKAR